MEERRRTSRQMTVEEEQAARAAAIAQELPPPPKIVEKPRPTGAVIVRTYEDEIAFENDASDLAQSGYFPVTVTHRPQRAGFGRGLALGLMALVWQPASQLLVTYRRQ